MNIETLAYLPVVSKVRWDGCPDGPGVLWCQISLLRHNYGTGCPPETEPCNGTLLVMGLQVPLKTTCALGKREAGWVEERASECYLSRQQPVLWARLGIVDLQGFTLSYSLTAQLSHGTFQAGGRSWVRLLSAPGDER